MSKNEKLNKKCLICNQTGVKCYCNVKDKLFETRGRWTIYRCENCDIFWIAEKIKQEDLSHFYKNIPVSETKFYNFDDKNIRSYLKRLILGASFNYKKLVENKIELFLGYLLSALPIYKKIYFEVMGVKYKKNGKLLDIGSGTGQFIYKMKNLGWDAYGIEPYNKRAAFYAQKKNLSVLNQPFEDTKFPDNYFNVIVINHVIEHLPNPIVVLHECYRILKPGGELILNTPNSNSLVHKIFGENYYHLDPPRHLYLFSIKALEKIFRSTGFVLEKKVSFTRIPSWIESRAISKNIQNKFYGTSRNTFRKFLIEEYVFRIFLFVFTKLFNMGEEMHMRARK
jgi:2-polyprenyl-3-methyl-5-hydroxy-6-metoxy-1,4-benzoquinol methylase